MQRSRVSAMPNGSVLLKQRVRLSFVMAMLWVLGGGMTEKEQAQLEVSGRARALRPAGIVVPLVCWCSLGLCSLGL